MISLHDNVKLHDSVKASSRLYPLNRDIAESMRSRSTSSLSRTLELTVPSSLKRLQTTRYVNPADALLAAADADAAMLEFAVALMSAHSSYQDAFKSFDINGNGD